MASIINASTAGVGGVITTADNSGILNLQTGGTTAVTIDASQNVGIGTASPASALFVSANTATGGVPEINLENSQNFEAANYLNYKTELIFRGDKQNRYSSAGAILGPLASIATIYSNPTLTADSAQGAGALTFSTRAATATTSSDTLTERMRIDSSGNLGIGTTSPTQKLDVVASGAATAIRVATTSSHAAFLEASSNTATVRTRLQANPTDAFTGTLSNHAFFFQTNGTERMRIDSSGNLLVGTTSATAKVVIKCSTNNFGGGLQLHQSNFDTRWEYIAGSDGKLYLGYGSATTPSAVGNFATNGTYTATSDIRKKKDITYDFNATEIVMRLKPAMGRMIDDSDESPLRPFYIAQDMTEVVPSLVSSLDPDQDAIDPIMGVDYASSVPLLAKMLQEQQALITSLTARLDVLENK